MFVFQQKSFSFSFYSKFVHILPWKKKMLHHYVTYQGFNNHAIDYACIRYFWNPYVMLVLYTYSNNS